MTQPKNNGIRIDGMKQASELLSGVDEATRTRILNEIAVQNPVLAARLKKEMVSLETVLSLPPVELAKVIGEVSEAFLALALRGLSPEIQSNFFNQISRRRADEIKTEFEAMGPRKQGDVKAAQEKLIEIAQALFDSGQITTKLTKG